MNCKDLKPWNVKDLCQLCNEDPSPFVIRIDSMRNGSCSACDRWLPVCNQCGQCRKCFIEELPVDERKKYK